jgi:hypothetical protein
MHPEKVQVVLLALIALVSLGLAWQIRARALFERWVRRELMCQQRAHARLCDAVKDVDLRVPKRRPAAVPRPGAGWGTLLDGAETRVACGAETFPALGPGGAGGKPAAVDGGAPRVSGARGPEIGPGAEVGPGRFFVWRLKVEWCRL